MEVHVHCTTYRKGSLNQTSQNNKTTRSPHQQDRKTRNLEGYTHTGGRLFHRSQHRTRYDYRLNRARENITPANQHSPFTDLAVDGPTVPGRKRGEGPQGSAVIKDLIGASSGELVKVGVDRPRRTNA